MKRKTFFKKFALNKQTVSNLDVHEISKIKAGNLPVSEAAPSECCQTEYENTCQQTCNFSCWLTDCCISFILHC